MMHKPETIETNNPNPKLYRNSKIELPKDT